MLERKTISSEPFDAISKKEPTVERSFTYEAYWQPATSGPNFCRMSIWDDGLIRIHHKTSLGPNGYLYFSMNGDMATAINDLVFSLLDADSTDGSFFSSTVDFLNHIL